MRFLVGLQEVRWHGQRQIDKRENFLLYSGSEERTGQFVTGFILSKKMRSLLEF